MSRERSEAFVLQVDDLFEGDRIVDFLTARRGRRRGVARGARRKFSRFAGALRQLAKVDVGWFEKADRDLVRIADVSMIEPPDEIQADLEGALLSGYLAEHVQVFVQENEPAERWYRLLDSTVAALRAGVERDLVIRYFEVWALRLSGIFPPPRECPSCERAIGAPAYLEGTDGAVVCARCFQSGEQITASELAFLVRSATEDLAGIARGGVSSGVLRRLERLTTRVRRQFLDRELKSYEVLRSTLAAVEGGR